MDERVHALRRAAAAVLALAAASSATAGISLMVEQPGARSEDVMIRWEAEGPGPFSLLARDIPVGQLPAAHVPSGPAHAVMTGLTGSSVVLRGGAVFPPTHDGRVLRLIDESDGSCSNLGYVMVRRRLRAGSAALVGLPGRTTLLTLSSLLRAWPDVSGAMLVEPEHCRATRLMRGFGGVTTGLDAFIPAGRSPSIFIARDTDIVIAGAADPAHEGTLLQLAQPACGFQEQIALPWLCEPPAADGILCGDYPDANRDGNPEACDGGWFDGRAIAISQDARHGDSPVTSCALVPRLGSLTFSGMKYPIDGTCGQRPRATSTEAQPVRVLATRDAGAPESCRCLDGDGDGDDDCAERLHGTDPDDASSHGRDADRDGTRDEDDTCPGHPNPDQSNADGDEFGDACDPDPADADNAVADGDGDGVLDGRDSCPFVADPDQLDGDADRTGDACDNCPDTFASQLDSDFDGLGDACDSCPTDPAPDTDGDDRCSGDNCPVTPNTGQEDGDSDGFGDACDCRDRPLLPPVRGLRVGGVGASSAIFHRLTWPFAPAGAVHDVLRGDIDELHRGSVAGAECLARGLTSPTHVVAPRSGSAWYVVRWRTACEGTSAGLAEIDRQGVGACP